MTMENVYLPEIQLPNYTAKPSYQYSGYLDLKTFQTIDAEDVFIIDSILEEPIEDAIQSMRTTLNAIPEESHV